MQTILTAVALILVLEGLLPFVSPASWRLVMRRIGAMADGQIRFFGFSSILVGLAIFLLLID